MSSTETPRPITMTEMERVRAGAHPELNWLMVESAYISDWWNPTEEDIKHFKYILTLDIDTSIILTFMSTLGQHGGRRVSQVLRKEANSNWKVKSDHKNALERRDLKERARKWGVTYNEDSPMYDEEVWR